MQRAGQLSVCRGKKDQQARLPVVSGQWPQSREVCEVGRQEDICRRGFECTGERLLSRPGCQENMQECTGERPVLGQAGSGTTAEATTAISCNSGQQQHQCQSSPKSYTVGHIWVFLWLNSQIWKETGPKWALRWQSFLTWQSYARCWRKLVFTKRAAKICIIWSNLLPSIGNALWSPTSWSTAPVFFVERPKYLMMHNE